MSKATDKAPKALPKPPPGRLRTFCRLAIVWMVLPLGALLVLFWFVIGPWLAGRWIEETVASRIRGRITVGTVSLGMREFHVKDIRLTDATGRQLAQADVAVLRLDRPLWSGGSPQVNQVRLEGADMEATLEPGGTWDLQRALQRSDLPRAPSPSPGPSTAPPPVQPAPTPPSLESIIIQNGSLRLRTPLGFARVAAIEGTIEVELQRYVLRAEGTAWAGRISADGWFGTWGTEDWSVQVNASRVDVRALSRDSSVAGRRLEGTLDGFISIDRLRNDPPVGAGWLDIRDGHLFDLPVFFAVFNILRFESPEDSGVHTCRSDFRILPGEIRIERSFLLSRGPSLYGTGTIALPSGELDLEFIPRLSGEPPEGWESLADGEQPVRDFVRAHALLSVELTGTWKSPVAEAVPVKFLTRPIRDFFRLLQDRQ